MAFMKNFMVKARPIFKKMGLPQYGGHLNLNNQNKRVSINSLNIKTIAELAKKARKG